MPTAVAPTLRAISCKFCHERFYICSRCYRGQEYCGKVCGEQARRRQLREANRRHRQSPEGQADHRDRQRAYRECRRLRASVLDQSSNSTADDAMIATPVPPATATATTDDQPADPLQPGVREVVRWLVRVEVRCQICGRRGEFIDISTA